MRIQIPGTYRKIGFTLSLLLFFALLLTACSGSKDRAACHRDSTGQCCLPRILFRRPAPGHATVEVLPPTATLPAPSSTAGLPTPTLPPTATPVPTRRPCLPRRLTPPPPRWESAPLARSRSIRWCRCMCPPVNSSWGRPTTDKEAKRTIEGGRAYPENPPAYRVPGWILDRQIRGHQPPVCLVRGRGRLRAALGNQLVYLR